MLQKSSTTILEGPPPVSEGDITTLLQAWSRGDEGALTALVPRVYDELSGLARHYLRRERRDHTLATGALVHEVYLKVHCLEQVSFEDRAHFYALCAKLMRHILVDHARRLARRKRGGGLQRVALEDALGAAREQAPALVALDDALKALARSHPQQARVVELRYFGGLGRDEIGRAMGLSSATVTRRWRTARARLYRYLVEEGDEL